MKDCAKRISFLSLLSYGSWALLVFIPLLMLFQSAVPSVHLMHTKIALSGVVLRTAALSGIIAFVAVVLGYFPGRLLGTCASKNRDVLLPLLLVPLVLPQYVLYYAWALLLSPTTQLGRFIAEKPELARTACTITTAMVLILWHWPLAALLISQGWRNIDRHVWDCVALDADSIQSTKYVTFPLLARPLLLAFGICFVMSMSESTAFHLAGLRTVGTELAVIYELTGSESSATRAALPVTIVALIAAVGMGRNVRAWASTVPPLGDEVRPASKWAWWLFVILLAISIAAPVGLFLRALSNLTPFRQFLTLHLDEVLWSLLTATIAALLAHLIAFSAVSCRARRFQLFIQTTLFIAMLIPGSLVAIALLKLIIVFHFPAIIRQGWVSVAAGQAMRFSGIAFIFLLLTRDSHERHLSELALHDGASPLQAWWHIHLPRTWPLFAGSFLLILMFCITEVSATMVLLPPGLPNFAQRLLNQMHYAGDQQVIASCLALICLFVILAAIIIVLVRASRLRQALAVLIAFVALSISSGCDIRHDSAGEPNVVDVFGRTGKGQCEFLYPRGIDMAADSSIFVIDKAGRIQHLGAKGDYIGEFSMPLNEAGKPVGISCAPDGTIYVADTHYHRVVVLSSDGKMLREFGRFGEENGSFIYPTDVAFSGDGRIFVSEYGGNDRINVFDESGKFLYSFGEPGEGQGQLSRPNCMCVDQVNKRLYIADACNHRIAVYTFDGSVVGYIGAAGTEPGRLRFPYGVALSEEGNLVVCENGNNRIQVFSSDGRSLAVYGMAGREPGQLAYPWGLAVDKHGRAFIVDAGNNRIQIWQL